MTQTMLKMLRSTPLTYPFTSQAFVSFQLNQLIYFRKKYNCCFCFQILMHKLHGERELFFQPARSKIAQDMRSEITQPRKEVGFLKIICLL